MADATQPLSTHFQSLINLFPESIIVLDLQGVITTVDKQTLSLFGWESEKELIGKNNFDLIIPEDQGAAREAFQKIVTNGSITGFECSALKKDQSTMRLSVNGSLLIDNEGKPKEVIAVVHDITNAQSKIDQLKEAERQLSEAQQIAHYGSWVWDITTNTFHWSDELYRLLGMTPQSGPVSNDVLIEHVHEEDKEQVRQFIDNALKNGSDVLDFRSNKPTPENPQWFHSRSKTFYDTTNKPLRMVGTVRDVTHDKELDQVKTQFLSLASHQMRGPLTTINWNAEMLLQQQSEGISDNQKKYIQELYNASKRTVQMTNDLLTVSELELGRMPFKPEKLSIQKVAKRVLEDYEHKIAEAKINFKEVYVGELPDIETDLFLLKTIFHQLISNAVVYTPPEGTITFTASVDPQRTNSFLITIADTGYGIPKDQQDKVFTKLFRATNAKEKVMGGTGLGLYIVKLILKLNGGDIWFTSEENKGTTFTVSLPFAPEMTDTTVQLPQ